MYLETKEELFEKIKDYNKKIKEQKHKVEDTQELVGLMNLINLRENLIRDYDLLYFITVLRKAMQIAPSHEKNHSATYHYVNNYLMEAEKKILRESTNIKQKKED